MMGKMVCCVGLFLLVSTTLAQDQGIIDLANANAGFGFKLYSKIAEQDDAENIFFSPYSISVAMAMVYLGSGGNTRKEVGDVFGFSELADGTVKENFRKTIKMLVSDNNDFILEVANKFYPQKDYHFEKTYVDDLLAYYGAKVQEVDYRVEYEATRQLINSWVEEETKGTIKDLFPEGSIDSSTVLALVNAIYFKASWKYQFEPEHTSDQDFNLLDGSTVSVPMMTIKAEFRMASDIPNKYQVLELPYSGEAVDMYIAVPFEKTGLSAMESVLNAEKLNSLIRQMSKSETTIVVPKFKVTQQMDLPVILKALGIRDLFSTKADLSGIDSTSRLYVSEIVHQAYISIDEEGTEASAATGIAVSRMSAQVFRVDQPFMVFIRDKGTGSILFMGRVVNPKTATEPLKLRMMRSVGDNPGEVSGSSRQLAGHALVAMAIAVLMVFNN